MSFFSSLDISASGLAAQRMRTTVAARNLANIGVTRDENGNVPKRMRAVFRVGAPSVTGSELTGVSVVEVRPSPNPTMKIHDPTHPDADPKTGLVEMPNINAPLEMTDMMMASRAYEANITAIDVTRRLIAATLQIMA